MLSTKITIATTASVVTASLIASVFHLDLITMFIDTSLTYNLVRIGAILVLLSLLVIKPPRSLSVRAFLGAAGIALHAWSINALLYSNGIFLDALVFMAVAIVLEVEALEPQTVAAPRSNFRKMPA